MKVALFLPTWVGDAAMATPAVRALRTHFGPRAELLGIGRPYLRDLFAGTPWFDRWIDYHPTGKDRSARAWAVASRLKPLGLDLAILFRNSFREAALAWYAGARRRIGYAAYWRGRLLTDRLQFPTENGRPVPYRMVDFYLKLAEAAGCPPEPPRVELATTPADEEQADRTLRELGDVGRRGLVVFNCSGAYGAAKLWPVESFGGLGRRIAAELGRDVVVICGPAERENAARIAALADHPRVFSLDRVPSSFGLSKALVRRSELMVTTDSGPRQFAVAFDVPVVTLCGASHIAWGANPLARETALQLPLACVPCQRHVCPLKHHRCMRDLSVAQVFATVAEQLAAKPAIAAG